MHKMLKEILELNKYFEAKTPSSLRECEDKINNSKGGGFLGYIPDLLLEKIPEGKSEIDFFKMFNNFVLLIKKRKTQQAEQIINQFFNNNIKFSIEIKEYSHAAYTRFGVIIKQNINDEKFFVKIFKKHYEKEQLFYYRHGPYVESTVALFINHHLKNSPYFVKFYFANPKEYYLVTKFVDSCIKLKREEFVEMNIKDNPNLKEKTENAAKLFEKYTGEYINHHKMIKSLKGGCFRYLDYHEDNFFIYEDKDKKRHCMLIDYGYFISYNENNRVL